MLVAKRGVNQFEAVGNINAILSVVSTSITSVQVFAITVCNVASTNAINHATKANVCHVIDRLLMNCIVNVEPTLFTHPYHAARKSQPVIDHVHEFNPVIILSSTTAILVIVHHVWLLLHDTVMANTNNV